MRMSDWSSDVCSSDLLGLAGTGAALFALTSQANRYTEIRSRLVPLFEAQTDVNKAMRDTVRIANEARTGLVPVADLYARLTLGGREFGMRSEEHTSELQSLMRISYAVFCLKKKK